MEIVKDIITSLAAIAAVVIAAIGLQTWRRQLKATEDSNLARRILISLYKVKAEIANLRRPLREVSIPESDNKFDDQVQNEAFAKQYQAEWNALVRELAELEALSVEAQAVWDLKFNKYLADVRGVANELRQHISEHLAMKRDNLYESYLDKKEIRKVLFGIGGDDDDFAKKVDAAIEKVDSQVRPRFIR